VEGVANMERSEAVKILTRTAKDLTKAEQKVAALEVTRKEAIEKYDSSIKAARLDVLRVKGLVEAATTAVVNPPRNVTPAPSALTRISEMSRVAH